MDNICNELEVEFLPTGIFELLGKPAMVTNGVPAISPSEGVVVLSSSVSDAESQGDTSQIKMQNFLEIQVLVNDWKEEMFESCLGSTIIVSNVPISCRSFTSFQSPAEFWFQSPGTP
ncbi:hypothetical protein DKX38_024116 [Salix brachista]|uniref:Uncharacterized protein n=1 Tax=Salix brachista TaxID=2182728 RepID=A0A5N5JY80_9ROSI|nr:hypothetical protein DKX38_024116 [Salix brachista]